MSRFWPLVLTSLGALPGCQGTSAGPEDAAPPSPDARGSAEDAAPQPDADPSCRSWRSAPAPIASASLEETRPVRVGRSARLRVEVEQCPGDLPGPWDVSFTLENEFLVVSARTWRSGPDCDVPAYAVRHVSVTFPYAGEWELLTAGESLVIDVEPARAGACGSAPESDCERDCDCPTGERCLSGLGPQGPIQRCARPCEFDRECQGGDCGDHGGLSGVCSSELDECGPGDACPEGFECEAGRCAPTFVLNASTRHECACDAECDPGLRCVALFDGEQTTTSCEVLCPTRASDGFCQGAHSCDPAATIEPDFGVCGWVGE